LISAGILIRKIRVGIERNEPAITTHPLAEVENIYQITRICRRRRRNLATAGWQPGVEICCEYFFITAR